MIDWMLALDPKLVTSQSCDNNEDKVFFQEGSGSASPLNDLFRAQTNNGFWYSIIL